MPPDADVLAVRAFLRFEAKMRIIRDAMRAYLANPVYAFQKTA
jgi:hypothetical protein